MKQKFTTKKNKYLENKKSKNETMFNFKISCLMKKQFISLMMVLAMVILAGTSAFAQNGTESSPYWHVNGSTHTLTVTNNSNSDFAWTSSGTSGVDFTWSGTNSNVLSVTWSEDAAGAYYFDVTETDKTNDCEQTVRRVYVSVLDFDVDVFFASSAGADIEGEAALMSACGAGSVANYGDIVDGETNVAFSQVIDIESSGTAGDLSEQVGTNPYTERYIGMTITWNIPADATFTAPDVASMKFDYSLSLTDADNTFVSFNSNAAASGSDQTIDESSTENLFIVPILYNAQWGIEDVTTAVTVTNCTLYDGDNNVVGTELNSNEADAGSNDPLQNTTATQTIWSAPATSTITVN